MRAAVILPKNLKPKASPTSTALKRIPPGRVPRVAAVAAAGVLTGAAEVVAVVAGAVDAAVADTMAAAAADLAAAVAAIAAEVANKPED